ncbi:MAG: IPT/TIG domain-containing protein [Candidatus Margulisiibacteriota bacterium]
MRITMRVFCKVILFLFATAVIAAPAISADFYPSGYVYNFNATSGESATPNSYGTAHIFRRSIASQIASSIYGGDYFVAGATAARFEVNTDTPWTTGASAGQNATVIVETLRGVNGYSGDLDYVGAINHTITSQDLLNGYFLFDSQGSVLYNAYIQPIPTPESKSKTENTIIISWEGIATSDASSNLVNSAETYAVYYSTSPTGLFTFEGTATHVSGEVTYTHSGVSSANTYYYKLKMRYAWPGNTPTYYETTAESSTSEGIRPLTPSPVVSGIAPSVTQNTGIKTFVISGSYFTDANGASLHRTGFTALTTDEVTVISDSTLVATLELNPAVQAIGTWDVRVSNPTTYGTGSSLLTLTAEAPTISSVEPASGSTNTTIEGFQVYGQRLYPGSTVKITLGSATFSASSVTTNSGYSMLTCNLPVLTNATIGTWDVVVTSMFGQATREAFFTVTAEAPTLTSITPSRGATSSTVTITSLAGTNLFNGALVELRKSGQSPITAEGISANAGHTSLGGTINLTGATTGAWSVFVQNTDSQVATGEDFFTVTSAPVVSSIIPATRENNDSAAVTIRGSNFFSTPEVSLSKTGMATIDAAGEILISSTEMTCTLLITNATIGTRDVVATNSDGTGILSNGFTITSESPSYISIAPASGNGGDTVPVTIAGDKFYAGAIVQLRKTGRTTIAAASVSVPDINTINCNLTLPSGNDDVGLWDIYIVNTDEKSTSESGVFTVNYGTVEAPSDCAITPLSTTSVSITWTDNSPNEELFRVQRSANGTSYTTIGTTAAGVVTYTGDGTTGLSVNTIYWFRVRAEGGGQESAFSTALPKYTLASAPSAETFDSSTSTVITANWSAGLNPAGTQYYCQNQTNSNDSGNISVFTWQNTGLLPDTDYTYRVRAINGDGIAGEWVSLGTSRTREKKSVYYFAVDGVKLLSGDILGSVANISVVFSSETAISIPSFRMYIDGREVTDGTNTYYDSYSTEGIFTTVNYKIKTALTEGTYTVLASATDSSGILYEDERTNLQVMSDSTKLVVGYVLMYPNPYDPTKGSVKLTYRLATDTNTTIYVFDVNGRLVWKESYISQFNGGKAGYNEVLWNGYDVFSRILDNDVYLIRIVESGSGKVMGKGKLVILKTVSSKTDKDREQKVAAVPVDSGGDFWGGIKGKGPIGFGGIILVTLVGLLAFEELARMYFHLKQIGRLKR